VKHREHTQNHRCRAACRSIVGAVTLLCTPLVSVFGQSYTWTGGGDNDNWSTAGNWAAGGGAPAPPPLSGPEQTLIFDGETRRTPNQDKVPRFELNSLNFARGGFRIAGKPIRFSGVTPTLNANGDAVIECQLELNADTTIKGNFSSLELSGVISDAGAAKQKLILSPSGTGAITVSGANTYGGGTVLNAGFLAVDNDKALGDAAGRLSLNGGTILATKQGNRTIENPVTIAGNINFGSGMNKEEKKLIFTGKVTLEGAINTLNVGPRVVGFPGITSSVDFRGTLADGGLGFIKEGRGTLTLGEPRKRPRVVNDDFTGPIIIKYGRFSNYSELGVKQRIELFRVDEDAVWSDAGKINATLRATTKSTYHPGDGPGISVIDGDLILDTGAILESELDGPTPGEGRGSYAQAQVTGNISLDGAVLRVVLDSTPVLSHRYVIIANNGTNLISGTFTNLPEGGVFDVPCNGVTNQFQITYAGNGTNSAGVGKDLVITALTAVPVPQPVLSITQSGDQVTVSWPEVFTGYTLQATTDWEADWLDVPLTATNSVTLGANGGWQFFKLNRL
jgi:autotransporter-associated beta strand protein